MQDDVQLHDRDLRHALQDWPQRRASQRFFPWLDVRDCPAVGPPRHLVKISSTRDRTAQSRLPGPAFPTSVSPYIIPSDPLLALILRSALFPASPVFLQHKIRPVPDPQLDYRPVGQPHRHKSTSDGSSSTQHSRPNAGQRAFFRTTSQSCLPASARDAAFRRALRCTESVR
jgi:hypothetical protein